MQSMKHCSAPKTAMFDSTAPTPIALNRKQEKCHDKSLKDKDIYVQMSVPRIGPAHISSPITVAFR